MIQGVLLQLILSNKTMFKGVKIHKSNPSRQEKINYRTGIYLLSSQIVYDQNHYFGFPSGTKTETQIDWYSLMNMRQLQILFSKPKLDMRLFVDLAEFTYYY